VLAPVTVLAYASRLLAALLLAVGVVRWRQGRAARRSATWGCGYLAGSPRMQYTGSSFSEHFTRIFDSCMPALRRERLPSELFPQAPGELRTHHGDAVEQRIFEVLARGEDVITSVSERIPAQPRFAFAAGLCAVLILGAVAWGGWR
jgi:hydrogenase-4 component B